MQKLAYVGSTSLHIKTRLSNHISSYKKGCSKCSSIKVLMCPDYEVKVLEKFDEDLITIKALKLKEREYIQIQRENGFEIVNKNVPARSSLDYYYDHKARLLEKQKGRYQSDPEFKVKVIKQAKDRYVNIQEFKRLGKAVDAFTV
jgi:hypothetical protein